MKFSILKLPISLARLARGLRIWTRNLCESIRISRILFKNANRGAIGNATTNNVIKPN